MNTLYVGANGIVTAINPSNGEEDWRTRLGGGGFFSSKAWSEVALIESGDVLYVDCNGHIFCLDKTLGNILWENDLPGMGVNDMCLSASGQVSKTRRTPG